MGPADQPTNPAIITQSHHYEVSGIAVGIGVGFVAMPMPMAMAMAVMMGGRVLIIRFDNIMIALVLNLYRLYLVIGICTIGATIWGIVKWVRHTGAERARIND